MARYQDYLEKQDSIEDEIVEAAEKQEERETKSEDDGFVIPERFKDKSPEEIARAYTELERLNGRQANDLGNMRKTVDELLELQSQVSGPPEEEDSPVTVDDLYENAEEAISRVVTKKADSRIKVLEEELENSKVKERLGQLENDHPEWRKLVKDGKFRDWVAESPYRSRLALDADAYDFEAADTLFSLYRDTKGSTVTDRKERDKQFNDATLESSAATSPEPEENFSRRNLLQARLAAKKGNKEARQWLADNSQAITEAYDQGRIVD